MKKIAILLSLILCTTITGCSNMKTSNKDQNTTSASAESTDGTSSSNTSSESNSETSNTSIKVTDSEGVGTDLFNGRVEIDGTVYKLGTPVKEWIKDGWELYGLVDQRIAPETSLHAVKMKKGNTRIGISVHNKSLDIAGLEDGIVSGVSIDDGSTTKISSFSIAGNIKLGMTQEDLDKVVAGYKVDKTEGTSTLSYSLCRNYSYTINILFTTDKKIKRISVQVI